jgi:hypothetical protein
MKGANEYSKLFSTGQYGRLYIVSGSHARGRTFHIQILPTGEKAEENGENNLCLNFNAVEVYGILGGQPGWSEYYGWIYTGPWQKDFEKLVETRKKEIATEQIHLKLHKKNVEKAKNERIKKLLESY